MTTKNEALKMAIDWFEIAEMDITEFAYKQASPIIQACKEALEQPTWQSLTNDEILAIDDVTLGDYYVESMANNFARAIEKALKEKNG